jgi:quinoprotein glucose dehydrogenase
MSQTRSRKRRYFQTAFGLAAAFAAVVATRAQSSPDKWWPGYGNGPDNSRYFASKQINKSNVNQLQVAWTYPYRDTGGYPIVERGAIYGPGRNSKASSPI